MNRVRRRAWIMLVFMGILLGGLGFFLYEYSAHAEDWVTFKGSPHVYAGSYAVAGTVTDREGTVLLDGTDGLRFAEDSTVRQGMLHWLGDRQGNINASALREYAKAMAGYSPVNGVYSYAELPGTLELTLSSRVQAAALKAMAGRKGTIAVYNYQTGQILCALSTPTYDPDNVPNIAGDTTGIYEGVYVNRFIQSTYPPGSIFKVVTTAAALEAVEGILDMTFTCEGVYALGGSQVTCERYHGTLDLKSAMASSCNCAYAQIALLLGNETLEEYAEAFGILDSLSFDGLTTAKGNFDLRDADKVALAWSAIGQYTDMVNPCQYMAFLGAVANGGRGAVPYLVEQVRVGDKVTYEAEPLLGERIMDAEIAATLAQYMRNNVEQVYGAGNFPGLTVCAKSGTSELGGGKTPNAMFAGFVMDEAYPLAFIVVVENGGYGAHTCVPVLAPVLAECKAALDGK